MDPAPSPVDTFRHGGAGDPTALDRLQVNPRAGDAVIVDGALVPTRSREVLASSKNRRLSTNLHILYADTHLVLAVARSLPGNRNRTAGHSSSAVSTPPAAAQ
ncbi:MULTISPECIES: hypothetical protein [Streptomycetaceae]|uniref:hypothetical protein n=1 Tax=Embleya scabrispora TaxID=159449 RepID=UPI00036110BF|nr:hypothetical protein [Streptomyces sp. SID5474]